MFHNVNRIGFGLGEPPKFGGSVAFRSKRHCERAIGRTWSPGQVLAQLSESEVFQKKAKFAQGLSENSIGHGMTHHNHAGFRGKSWTPLTVPSAAMLLICSAGPALAGDADCNHNLIADDVEVQKGSVQDCNGNGQPDECDEGLEYTLENGIGSEVWGGSLNGPLDYLWLNTFRVKPGGQRITHVAAAWVSFTPHLHPGVALIYSDPNQDGNPSDAQLLSQSPIVGHNDFGLANPLTFTTYPMPTTEIGEPGQTFFVGFKMTQPIDTYVAVSGSTSGQHGWRSAAAQGTIDLENPGTFTVMPTWAVRAAGLDCNGNGIPDSCDITAGTSLDINRNGIADECEPDCAADSAPAGGDGEVNVEDLLQVIGDWGPCDGPCPGDVTYNDIVNVQDLLAVISAWGACP